MEERTKRRTFLKEAAALGAGAALAPLWGAATAHAASLETPVPLGKPRLSMAEVRRVAREKLFPHCRLCPECNGVACAGEVPGFGGVGTGSSFTNNYDAIQRIKVRMRVQHGIKKPDMAVNIFGRELALPVLGAPMGGVSLNMGGKMHAEEFLNAILGGSLAAGTLGMVPDGLPEPVETFGRRMDVLQGVYSGNGIVIIKPRTQAEILRRLALVERAGALAFGVDVDSAGWGARALPGQSLEHKSPEQLHELASATSLPFIVKGVMTAQEAVQAMQAGARGIVVSNHGGRVLDSAQGVAEVLPEIAAAVKGKVTIFADGAVRRGLDVLKLLALGADACLVGRPLIHGAFGAGKEGVCLTLETIREELSAAMLLTGVASVRQIPSSLLVGV